MPAQFVIGKKDHVIGKDDEGLFNAEEFIPV